MIGEKKELICYFWRMCRRIPWYFRETVQGEGDEGGNKRKVNQMERGKRRRRGPLDLFSPLLCGETASERVSFEFGKEGVGRSA